MRLSCTALAAVLALVLGLLPLRAWANASDWSIGGYVGQYHDTEPAGDLSDASQSDRRCSDRNGDCLRDRVLAWSETGWARHTHKRGRRGQRVHVFPSDRALRVASRSRLDGSRFRMK